MNAASRKGLRAVTLLTIANFLVAFGGGSILGQEGVKEIQGKTDLPILALLIGSSLSVFLLKITPSGILKRAGGWASIAAAICSFALLPLINYHVNDKQNIDLDLFLIITLFILRFALWYVSRTIRSDAVAGANHKLAWVDFSFYLGIILGMVAWVWPALRLAGQDSVEMLLWVLKFDALLLLAAGALDLISSRMMSAAPESGAGTRQAVTGGFDLVKYAKLAGALIVLTVGIQIVMLEFRNEFKDTNAPSHINHMDVWIIASIYFGGMLSALANTKVKYIFEPPRGARGSGAILIDLATLEWRLPFYIIASGSACLLLAAVVVRYLSPGALSSELTILLLVAASTFIYEIIALAVFNHIGREAKGAKKDGMVALTLGLMGLGGATHVLFWSLFESGKVKLIPEYAFWAGTVLAATLVASGLIRAARGQAASPAQG